MSIVNLKGENLSDASNCRNEIFVGEQCSLWIARCPASIAKCKNILPGGGAMLEALSVNTMSSHYTMIYVAQKEIV